MLLTHVAVLSTAVAALVAGGCGSSSKSSPTTATSAPAAAQLQSSGSTANASVTSATGPRLSQAALIAKADPICARVTAQRLSKHIKGAQAFRTAAAEAAIVEHKANEELAKLNPPASLASKWQQILVDYRTVTNDIEQTIQAMALRRTPVNIISNAEAARAQAAMLARQAGLKDCSQE